MFIRKKKIRGKEYAYLVENRYNKKKKQSRQKSTSYLGKVIILSSADRQTVASTLKEAIINELTNVGFKFKDNQLVKDSIVIDLNTVEVKENNKKVCLELNEGFLCTLTLNNLINFNSQNLNQKEIIHQLANSFVSAGINLHHESFVNIFTNMFKS
ncbi:hypothetical protein HOG16_03205 [Candidatus Woesearchaeota archaeon]|jgi:hypothetical protein|nr:hypothetical protein [Candidatus Woesearchaeota archaeon]MBT4322134.1 hypothetical protein [Candidatus Woesearchaeota archaeon]MBT4630970.1 hypothetical protein [Candidatus Woesearchaeota archaeon]